MGAEALTQFGLTEAKNKYRQAKSARDIARYLESKSALWQTPERERYKYCRKHYAKMTNGDKVGWPNLVSYSKHFAGKSRALSAG